MTKGGLKGCSGGDGLMGTVNSGEVCFTCEICGDSQSIGIGYIVTPVFPLCDQCKKDLGEIVKDKRNSATKPKLTQDEFIKSFSKDKK